MSGTTEGETPRPPVIGRIDQYELLRELGGGGFGCVYLAKDTVAGIEVAVKGLPPEVRHNKEELENIRENFALVSRLHHPNIAAALVLHPVRKTFYATKDAMEKLRVFEGDTLLVMEYAPGETLSSWRKRFPEKRVPYDLAVDIVRQIALALDYAHKRKIIHRDVKPANVMIEPQEDGKNEIRVLDFGLAAEIRSSMGRVSREIRDMSGTRPYMAPEQWGGERQGPATDQYALAVLFCELLSGEVPYQSVFDVGDSLAMMANVIHRPVKLPDGIPEKTRAPLLRALSKKPEERFASCGEFVRALDPSPRPPRWPWVAAFAFALALAFGVWHMCRQTTPEVTPPIASPVVSNVVYVAASNAEDTAGETLDVAPVSNVTPAVVTQSVVTQSVVTRSVVTQPTVADVSPVVVSPVVVQPVAVPPVVIPPPPKTPPVEKFPLSKALVTGKMPYGTDYGKEFHRHLRQAATGDADAQFCVGWMYKRGLGVGASVAQARKYFKKSEAKGNPYAVQALKEMGE